MTKRLLLFAGVCYYPDGGALDYQASAENTPELKEVYSKLVPKDPDDYWGMIVRASDMQILEVIGHCLGYDHMGSSKKWIPYPGKRGDN